jgi:hypothetical protein
MLRAAFAPHDRHHAQRTFRVCGGNALKQQEQQCETDANQTRLEQEVLMKTDGKNHDSQPHDDHDALQNQPQRGQPETPYDA